MKYDDRGVAVTNTLELCDLLYQQPDLDLARFTVTDAMQYNRSVEQLYAEMPQLMQYTLEQNVSIKEFDAHNQSNWHMPEEYKALDIAEWVLAQCANEAELQRCGEELLLYQERDAFNLLRYMKYLVDTMRAHGVVWGVGRGSSVASFVLYKIGVHRINSLYYDLDPQEFLK
jgi:DNA polymerase III alpha subunit